VSELSKTEKKERRDQVEMYYLQGYTVAGIAEKTGLKKKQVSADIKLVKRQLEPHKIWPIEYYRNKSRRQIGLALSKAWEIHNNNLKLPMISLSALRVIKELSKLLAEVDGVISEKMPTTAPKQAAALLKEIANLEIKAKSVPGKDGGNGHGDVEETVDAKPGS